MKGKRKGNRLRRSADGKTQVSDIFAAKRNPASAKPPPKFERALRPLASRDFFDRLDLWELNELAATIRRHVHWSIGEPTEAKLREIEGESQVLRDVIDFGAVVQRLGILDKFPKTTFGVSLSEFFPELNSVYEFARDAISTRPKSVEKAEAWLAPIAKRAGADADLEAAIYFASRGKSRVDPSELRQIWLKTLCYDIVRGKPVGKIPRDLLERAKSFTVSVSEAADVLEFNGSLNRFFGFRDEEEDFIDATFFRAVEWLSVTGYDRWLRAFSSELSAGPQYGVDHIRTGHWLFHWCRSNLALKMVEQQGLDSWLWGLANGAQSRAEPWKVFDSSERENPRLRDYVPLAAILAFAWHRIKPVRMNSDIVSAASEILLETQGNDGGWPVYRDEASPCLLTSCLAIHGLAAAQPRGWLQAARKGAEWLLSQQENGGHWDIQGGPTVMLTVLTLDSISLVNGGPTTISRSGQSARAASSKSPAPADYSRETWSTAKLPTIEKVGLNTAKKHFRPMLGIVVATKVELTAALKLLKPRATAKGVWQVSHANETYYLGRFGEFNAVLMLCSMGTQGASGSTLASDALISTWDPKVVILAGIAFGIDKRKHKAGDVLVAQSIIPYENQRAGKRVVFRNPIPPTSDLLVNRFKNVLDWDFPRPDGTLCDVHFGALLSGEKLIDDRKVKRHLMDNFPTAIGGEMEGAGLWASATRSRKEWLVVKAVCDWAENKDKTYQPLAAASAMSLCEHVFQNPHALDGV